MTDSITLKINGKDYEFPLFEKCGGGSSDNIEDCEVCQGSGYDHSKPIYYTPEDFKRITGVELNRDCALWHRVDQVYIATLFYASSRYNERYIQLVGQDKAPGRLQEG